jgi:hypothetical protein
MRIYIYYHICIYMFIYTLYIILSSIRMYVYIYIYIMYTQIYYGCIILYEEYIYIYIYIYIHTYIYIHIYTSATQINILVPFASSKWVKTKWKDVSATQTETQRDATQFVPEQLQLHTRTSIKHHWHHASLVTCHTRSDGRWPQGRQPPSLCMTRNTVYTDNERQTNTHTYIAKQLYLQINMQGKHIYDSLYIYIYIYMCVYASYQSMCI